MTSNKRAWIAGALAIGAVVAGASVSGCSADAGSDEVADDVVGGKPVVQLTDDQRREVISKKATCPFVGTSIALKKIFVYGSVANPFAIIADKPGAIVAVGNRGGGDLGEGFRIVARANHHKSPAQEEAPSGMFSLDFPASIGAHAAHSFVLMGDPRKRDSGRLNAQNLGRLINTKAAGGHAELAPNGRLVVRRSELGKFIARNVACDPEAVTASRRPFTLLGLLGSDIADFSAHAFEVVARKLAGNSTSAETTKLLEDMVQIAVANNLVGSAGEFGLLTTFLENSSESVTMPDGELALSTRDIEGMFAGDLKDGKYDPLTRHFPANWETKPKTIVGLLRNAVFILKNAAVSNLAGTYSADATCPKMQ